MTFNGRNIVITGGSVGIGYEVIKQFLDRGADVNIYLTRLSQNIVNSVLRILLFLI